MSDAFASRQPSTSSRFSPSPHERDVHSPGGDRRWRVPPRRRTRLAALRLDLGELSHGGGEFDLSGALEVVLDPPRAVDRQLVPVGVVERLPLAERRQQLADLGLLALGRLERGEHRRLLGGRDVAPTSLACASCFRVTDGCGVPAAVLTRAQVSCTAKFLQSTILCAWVATQARSTGV